MRAYASWYEKSERRGREVLCLALQAHLDACGHGDVGPALVLHGRDAPLCHKSKRAAMVRRPVTSAESTITVTSGSRDG